MGVVARELGSASGCHDRRILSGSMLLMNRSDASGLEGAARMRSKFTCKGGIVRVVWYQVKIMKKIFVV